MKIHELHLNGLSALRSRSYLCQFGGEHNPEALILEFSGKYGYGSGGNDDAAYVEAIKSMWLSVSFVQALVFDLRQMEYEFGNSIWNVFKWWPETTFDEGRPATRHLTALVVSDLCRPGFSTCQPMVPPMFDELEEALRFVEEPARKYLEDLLA